mmetsp:Transcript_99712/g.157828  ORF Transcript_99712/g.157828 Transcript_99712/m.157828 type:complete len:260 (+) Transcript_99712:63-842(+)
MPTMSLRCVESHGSLSSIDTVTPESAYRPSIASGLDTLSPDSDAGDKASKVDLAATLSSSSGSLKEQLDDDHGRHGPPPRQSTGDLRRRKYCAPSLGARWHAKLRLLPESGEVPAVEASEPSARASRKRNSSCDSERNISPTSSSCSARDDEVIIEGPLEQRTFWILWRTRWCVLTARELRVYRDEEEASGEPDCPVESYSVSEFRFKPDLRVPSVVHCMCVETGEAIASLRTGPGARWEELAAASLWLRSHELYKTCF